MERSLRWFSVSNEIEYVDFGFTEDETSYPLNDGANRASLIGSFQTVFNEENSPYDENWDYDTTNGFLGDTSELEYRGVLAIDDGKVAGFSWGYRVDTDQVDPEEKFPEELSEIDQNVYDGQTFMIDEVGVLPNYRGEGVGTELEERMIDKMQEDQDIFRTMQRTQWSGENTAKLFLDGKMGFQAFLLGEDNGPVTQDVPFVGKEGGDERIYLWRETRGEQR